MFSAINGMILDMLAAISRKDYDDRRRRAAQGIAKAKAEGKYRGRPANEPRNAGIAGMLRSGMSWSEIQAAAQCSRATVAKIAQKISNGSGGVRGPVFLTMPTTTPPSGPGF